ncbi:MAG TPA: ABC transporter ATP-binding protein [Thermoplasmata archaeon]|nr:ABC transporter ATP-binding protein [Thermoplasmata archaeon]
MLRLEGVDAGYGGTQVLWGVTLEAEARKMTVIIGANGAGKTTILKVVNGLLKPIRGEVRFNGEEITHTPAYRRPNLGLASVPEGRHLFPSLTTEANLRLGAYATRARRDTDETLESVYRIFPRLRERSRLKAGRLSGGEQQMVAIGRALMAKPTLLILDEPSLGLAPKVITEIFRTIRSLRDGGLTLLMVEQNAYQALRIADFGYVVRDGRIANQGPPDKLLDLEELRKAYFALT